MRLAFDPLVTNAGTTSSEAGFETMRPLIAREVVQHAILIALEKGDFLSSLTLQGGGSLRLCRGSNRYSDDLNFARGGDFNATEAAALSECIQDSVSSHLGLDVEVETSTSLDDAEVADYDSDVGEGGTPGTRQLQVTVSPGSNDLPPLNVGVTITYSPAYTHDLVALSPNCIFPPLYRARPILVPCKTLAEVAADKLVALANCEDIRHQDVWDLVWMAQQKVGLTSCCDAETQKLITQLVERKLVDHHVTDFDERIENLSQRLKEIGDTDKFSLEMSRCLSPDTIEHALGNSAFLEYIYAEMDEMCSTLRQYRSGKRNRSSFLM